MTWKTVTDKIESLVESRRHEIILLLRELVRVSSVTPPGDTRQVIERVARELDLAGIRYEVVHAEEDKPNIVARLGEIGNGPTLVLNSHVDTVGIGDVAKWKYGPFEATAENGRIYGRGVSDDKASVVGMTMAMKILAEMDVKLAGSLLFTPVSDEEVGGFKGSDFLLRKGIIKPSLAVVGEQTQNRIGLAEKGLAWFRLRTAGRAAHGSTPWLGDNAIQRMTTLLEMIDHNMDRIVKIKNHLLLPPASMNLGTISGGIKTNVVPDSCEATIDIRMLPGETPGTVQERLIRCIEEFRNKFGDVEMEMINWAEPFETPDDLPLVVVAKEVCSLLGLSPEPVGYQQCSDARLFSHLGIPTIILGPGDPRTGHIVDEYVDEDEVVQACKIYTLIAMKLLGAEDESV